MSIRDRRRRQRQLIQAKRDEALIAQAGVVPITVILDTTNDTIRTRYPDGIPSRLIQATLLKAAKGLEQTPIKSDKGVVLPQSGLILPEATIAQRFGANT